MININKLKLNIKKNKFFYKRTFIIYKILINLKIKFRYFFSTNKDIFTDIYLSNKWGDQFSVSGTGSNLNQTKTLLKEITKIIKDYKIKNILDIPCGDFYWIKEFDFKYINYVGGDIVSELVYEISKNIKTLI